MPYNNAPISAPEEITGTSSLPLARVKKIIAQDEDIAQCSNTAAFAISVATEIFIRYLTEQAHNVVKSERKPRRNIAYKDIATAVSRIDNLEFLTDVVPKTKTYRQFKEEKAQQEAQAAAARPRTQRGPDGGIVPIVPNGVSPTTATMNGTAGHRRQASSTGNHRIDLMMNAPSTTEEQHDEQLDQQGVNGTVNVGNRDEHSHSHSDPRLEEPLNGISGPGPSSIVHRGSAEVGGFGRSPRHGHPDPVRDIEMSG